MLKYSYDIIVGDGASCRRMHIDGGRASNPGLRASIAERHLFQEIKANRANRWGRYISAWDDLLTQPESNPKVLKSLKELGVATAVLHLAPADRSGRDVCIWRTPGCTAGCLATAGHGGMTGGELAPKIKLLSGKMYQPINDIENARILKTIWYFEDRPSFMQRLALAINSFAHYVATRLTKRVHAPLAPAVRLNATSDISWELEPFTLDGERYNNLFEAFPTLQFYDYTKNPVRRAIYRQRTGRSWPKNYFLLFSLAEPDRPVDGVRGQPMDYPRIALASGLNLSVVLDISSKDHHTPLPATWGGLPVVDADLHDFRPADLTIAKAAGLVPRRYDGPLICALRAKGRAIKDTSGFVRAVGMDDEFFEGAIVWSSNQGRLLGPAELAEAERQSVKMLPAYSRFLDVGALALQEVA